MVVARWSDNDGNIGKSTWFLKLSKFRKKSSGRQNTRSDLSKQIFPFGGCTKMRKALAIAFKHFQLIILGREVNFSNWAHPAFCCYLLPKFPHLSLFWQNSSFIVIFPFTSNFSLYITSKNYCWILLSFSFFVSFFNIQIVVLLRIVFKIFEFVRFTFSILYLHISKFMNMWRNSYIFTDSQNFRNLLVF